MQISDCCFLVAGGASGLGAATVRRLHEAGGRVVIADLNAATGEALAAELGPRARFARCDVSAEADAAAAVTAAVEAFGALHGLVNCAGIATGEKVIGRDGSAAPLAGFARVVNINLVGSFNMLRVAAAQMARQAPNADGERGVLINTASVAAFDGQIGQPAYAASKAGVVGMTLPLARELARYGIRCMTIAPGIFETPMMAGLPPEVQESLGKTVPFPPRLGRPDEYARLVQSIVENPMLNGECIRLDGALRMAAK
ncbi:SDR family NAD(P)-dependent oxidoreductase [Solimonas variicoloris]|uniref:SDR family NAD(P)-dependent oxidoreductase n=1 Tax=Solimonas variicoloris TaxID=254408 RepID=UPI0003622A55|nr:SDR family NAD(P)-dependent oxidoreductase [Solimonas variicoloris]